VNVWAVRIEKHLSAVIFVAAASKEEAEEWASDATDDYLTWENSDKEVRAEASPTAGHLSPDAFVLVKSQWLSADEARHRGSIED
jgi:hypothetical protein